MMEHLIDAYITAMPKETIIGSCECCGTVISDMDGHEKLKGNLFCDDDCISEYYECEEINIVEYCDECDEVLEESYIKDVYGNQFCDIGCLKKYYK